MTNKPRVYKRGSIWTVRYENSVTHSFASLNVEDWDEAVRIANLVSGRPIMTLAEIGFLRQRAKALDSNFRI